MEKKMVRKHFYFSGKVQGVGFRYKALYLARTYGLTGWAENLWDGRVEMEAQGQEESIGHLLAALQNDRFISIYSIEENEIPAVQESSFRIRG